MKNMNISRTNTNIMDISRTNSSIMDISRTNSNIMDIINIDKYNDIDTYILLNINKFFNNGKYINYIKQYIIDFNKKKYIKELQFINDDISCISPNNQSPFQNITYPTSPNLFRNLPFQSPFQSPTTSPSQSPSQSPIRFNNNVRDFLNVPFSTNKLLESKCFFENLFLHHSLSDRFKNNLKKDINRFNTLDHVTNFQVISQGSMGVAISADIDYEQNIFHNAILLKTVKNSKDNEELLHEFIIGLLCTNELRLMYHIPNFAFLFGIFKCSTPLVKDNKIISICSNPNSNSIRNYIIYEHINGISFKDFLYKCNIKQFMYTFIQILLALNVALEKFEYSHYDLHQDNIIMRSFPHNEFYTICYVDGIKHYCESHIPFIPTLIDFGFSHIKINNEHYGHECINANVFPDRIMPLFDTYKLLMCCLKIFNEDNGGCLRAMELLKFFKPEITNRETINNIKKQKDLYYALPYTFNTAKNDIEWEEFKEIYKIEEEYYSNIKDNKINNLGNFINHCINFCIENNLGIPIVREMDIDITKPIVYCEGHECKI
jgi:hypothetical protein